ncbi:tRNA lysidine(34) synthetase TilS [Streptococcus merionis]|uniref:tRNA(Ile)-lysidine synthase n=1 Tax=Streptococcus merionis TaxID=400065 RepID=A0A239SYV4_9STRE|nr:tRNA lysidine(34) synthetase TilS [Streptococcus merionis]SNU90429.1 ATPase [Streptococcus merionis]
MIRDKFLKVASERHFFDNHQKVLIAVSGGLDSMNLLEWMLNFQEQFQIEIGIAHVHHGQRPESDLEADYLESYARKHQIPFHFSKFTGQFSESYARDFRYRFFKECMKTYGYTALLTAHHADDQAETILMRIIRGSRLRHLSGMAERQSFGSGELIRPLLTFTKSELEPLFHFEDESNASLDYFRNRIRQNYLPQLSEENPRLSQHLNYLAQEVGDLSQSLAYFIKAIHYQNLAVFRVYPEAVQRQFLQDYLQQFPKLNIHKAQFEDLLHIIQTQKNKTLPIKQGYRLILTYEEFYLEKIQPETDEEVKPFVLQSENLVFYGDFQFGFNQRIKNADQKLYLHSENPVYLRTRQPGDQIQINGYHRKVRRWLIDQKIPLFERNKLLLIEQDQKILGIAGIVVSDLSKSPKNDTMKNILYIKKIK